MGDGTPERGRGERRVRGEARRAREPGRRVLGPVLEVMEALWALDHALDERERSAGGRFGITRSQRIVIRLIGQRPGVSAGDLSKILHVHPSTLTPVLHRLVADDMVVRAPDPGDRRRAILRLSRRGKRVDAVCSSRIDAVMSVALARHDPAEIGAMLRILTDVTEALAPRSSPRDAAGDAAAP